METGPEVVARAMELLTIGSRKKRKAIEILLPIAVEVDQYRRQRGDWNDRDDGKINLAPTWQEIVRTSADTLTQRRAPDTNREACRKWLVQLGESVEKVRAFHQSAELELAKAGI